MNNINKIIILVMIILISMFSCTIPNTNSSNPSDSGSGTEQGGSSTDEPKTNNIQTRNWKNYNGREFTAEIDTTTNQVVSVELLFPKDYITITSANNYTELSYLGTLLSLKYYVEKEHTIYDSDTDQYITTYAKYVTKDYYAKSSTESFQTYDDLVKSLKISSTDAYYERYTMELITTFKDSLGNILFQGETVPDSYGVIDNVTILYNGKSGFEREFRSHDMTIYVAGKIITILDSLFKTKITEISGFNPNLPIER